MPGLALTHKKNSSIISQFCGEEPPLVTSSQGLKIPAGMKNRPPMAGERGFMKTIGIVLLILLLLPGAALAARCPYCGQEYGAPAPGDEARVYALRRQHERECAASHRMNPGGGGGYQQGLLNAFQQGLQMGQQWNQIMQQRNWQQGYNLNQAGISYCNQGDFENAVSCFQQALQYVPNDQTIQYNLNHAMMWRAAGYGTDAFYGGNWQDAINWLEEAQRYEFDQDRQTRIEECRTKLEEDRVEELRRKQEEERREQHTKEQLAEAKIKFNSMLDKMSVDFDGTGKAGTAGSPERLAFMGTSGPTGEKPPLFEKGLQGSAPVDLRGVQVQAGVENPEQLKQDLLGDFAYQVQRRELEPNREATAIQHGLTIKEPPSPVKNLQELASGDVILVGVEPDPKKTGDWLISRAVVLGDRFGSGDWESPSSHTAVFLGERNGKRWYMDHVSETGTVILDEEAFLKKYGHRELNAAAVAQPLSKKQGDELWDAAHYLADNRKNNGLIDKNNYGVTGDNNMVCSEAARWVVMRAKGRYMPETDNKAEKAVGIKFSPQDFYDHEQYFVVTPLSAERAAAGQRGEK